MSIWLALRRWYPKTSAVVGNLRIKDVAGDVVLESSRLEMYKFKFSENFADFARNNS